MTTQAFPVVSASSTGGLCCCVCCSYTGRDGELEHGSHHALVLHCRRCADTPCEKHVRDGLCLGCWHEMKGGR